MARQAAPTHDIADRGTRRAARRRWALLPIALVVLAGSLPASRMQPAAGAGANITYVHDPNGRLVAVVDEAGQTARYFYDAVGNVTKITRAASSAISVIEVSPRTVVVGRSATVYGTGFSTTSSSNTVKFGTAVATITAASLTKLVVTVPAAATTGPLSVTSPAGAATTAFSVKVKPPAPAIASVSPTVATADNTLTINGSNFDTTPANDVTRLGDMFATVTAATSTRLTATVPIGVHTGRVTVATRDGAATSGSDVFVPPPPYTAADVSATARMAQNASTTVSFPRANTIALVAFDGTKDKNVSLQVTSTTGPSGAITLYQPDGTKVRSVFFGGGTVLDGTRLPVTGTYTIAIENTGDAGDVTFRLNGFTDVAATAALNGPAVTVTTTVVGQAARISFPGAAHDLVSAAISDVTFPFALASLFAPDGTTLATTSVQSGADWLLDATNLPSAGTYTVVLVPSEPGAATVRLYKFADVTGALTLNGAAVNVTTTVPGQNARLTLAGTASQIVSVTATNATFPDGAELTLVAPDGSTLNQAGAGPGSDGIVEQTALPTTGTYTVLVDPGNMSTGTVSLRAFQFTNVSASATVNGPPTTLTTTTPGQRAEVTFSATAGQRISATIDSVTFPSGIATLFAPDATPLSYASFGSAAGGFIDAITAPSSGTYKLVVDPDGTATGSAAVRVFAFGDIGGGITPNGATVTATTSKPGQNAVFLFSGNTSQLISMTIANATWPEGAFVSIVAPDGNQLGRTFVEPGDGFLDRVQLPVNGTYALVVDPQGASTGSADLRLLRFADVTASATPNGPAVTMTTTTPGQDAVVTFAGTAGQRASATITNPGYDASVSLTGPDGSNLATVFVTNGADAFIDAVDLPVDGTYTITLDASDTQTGTATVRVFAFSDVAGPITPNGAAVAASTALPGQRARYAFTANAPTSASVVITSATYPTGVWVSIVAADGTTLGSTFVSPGSDAFLDATSLPAAGTYSVLVDPSGTDTGSVSVRLYTFTDASVGATVDGPSVPISTTKPGQNGRVTFSANAGQRVTAAVTNITYSNGIAWLVAPDGSLLTLTFFSASDNVFVPAVDLTTTGTYTVLIDPSDTATGSARVQVQTTTTAAAATPPPAPATTASTTTTATTTTTTTPPVAPSPTTAPSRPAAARPRPAPDPSATGPLPDSRPWVPDPAALHGAWFSGRAAATDPPAPKPSKARRGVTAVSGFVRDLDGQPLAHVTLEIDGSSTRTDRRGRFLLKTTPGHHELLIDGTTAHSKAKFGIFENGVDVAAAKTTVLPYTIWMTPLDRAHEVKIASPTKRDTVITTPLIPGFEVRLPAGSVITDHDGKVVRKLSVTAIPVDRPPFPLPPGVHTPVYFTVQPGAAYVAPHGAQIIYPNTTHLAPGTRVDFWNYDPDDKGWYVYGKGSVTADATQIVPDPGVVVYEFTGAMINVGGMDPPGVGPNPGSGSGDGDPVDLGTGLFVYRKTDLRIPDDPPLDLTRTYRPNDTTVRRFGLGSNDPYGAFLWSANQYQEADLILPDGGRVHFVRSSPGTGYADARFAVDTPAPAFKGATMAWNGAGWDLALADGTVYVFGENQPMQAIRDRYGNTTRIVHDLGQSGNITMLQSPHGHWIRFTYDAAGAVTQAVDNVGRRVTYQYDASERLTQVTDAKGGITHYTYDTANRIRTIADARGNTFVTNVYDADGRVQKQTRADGGTFQFAYAFDANGIVTRTDVTDPRGFVRRTTFANGLPTSEVRAVGRPEQATTTFERSATSGLVTAIVDPRGIRTTYAYDAAGGITTEIQNAGTPAAGTYTYTYEPNFHQLATATDPLGHKTTYTYNTTGTVARITDGAGRVTQFTYDDEGHPLTTKNPTNNTYISIYQFGLPVTLIDPRSRTTSRFYDAVGRLLATTDFAGNTTSYADNNFGEPTLVVDPLSAPTVLQYDANGNVTKLSDANAHANTVTYDALDRITKRVDALGRQTTFSYDLSGNLAEQVDARGMKTVFRYDALDRRTFMGYGATGTAPNYTYANTTTTAFDKASRPTKVTDSIAGVITNTFDDRNRLATQATPQGSVTYGYDVANRRTAMIVAGQPAVSYTYDNADLLTRVTQGAIVAAYTLDAGGRPAVVSVPGGNTTSYTYDPASDITAATYKHGSAVLGGLTYQYDGGGRLERMSGSFARTGLPAVVGARTYDAANEMTAQDGSTLTYDAAGNLTGDGARSYAWDQRGHLRAISGASIASFTYDGFGRRVTKTMNGSTTGYLYDGANVAQELAGGTVSANMLNGLALDGRFARKEAAGTSSMLTGGLNGSALALVDSNGALQRQYTYEPYGVTTASGAASTNPYQYTGRENDGTGLYYYRNRYYSPARQRFLSTDPIGYTGNSFNLYEYVGGDPVDHRDPTGLNSSWGHGVSIDVPDPSDVINGIRDAPDTITDTAGDAISAAGDLAQKAADSPCVQGAAAASAGVAGIIAAAPELGLVPYAPEAAGLGYLGFGCLNGAGLLPSGEDIGNAYSWGWGHGWHGPISIPTPHVHLPSWGGHHFGLSF